MASPMDVADAAAELLTAWTMLENIRLEALPSFARKLDSSASGLSFPSDLAAINVYQNLERASVLSEHAAEAAMLEERTAAALDSFRSFCEILILQCQEQALPLAHLEPQLELPVYELLVEVANLRRNSTAPDPLREYRSMQNNLRRVAFQAKLASFFYSQPLSDLTISIFHFLVPQELRELTISDSRNWIAIKSCVEKLRQLDYYFASALSAHGWFYSTLETQVLVRKLQLVAQTVINDLWKRPDIVAKPCSDDRAGSAIFAILGLNRDLITSKELGWMKSVDNYRAILQDYNRECFRDTLVTVTNRRRFPVQGDGNCFYRAIIKSFWVNVEGVPESLLAQELRKRLNQPLVKNKMEAADGANSATETKDPYAEFTIDNDTDNATMATVGVWADHVQVKKTADFLERPVWILRHDDTNLKLVFKQRDGDWDASPGSQYKMLPDTTSTVTNKSSFSGADAHSGSGSSAHGAHSGENGSKYAQDSGISTDAHVSASDKLKGTRPPVVLFFTPEVHYDAFIVPYKAPEISPLSELETYALSPATPAIAKAHNLVHWWLDVEADLASLQVAQKKAQLLMTDEASVSAKQQELAIQTTSVLYKFSVVYHVLRRVQADSPGLLQDILHTPGGALTALTFLPIAQDPLEYDVPLLQWDTIKETAMNLQLDVKTLCRSVATSTGDYSHPLSSLITKLASAFDTIASLHVNKNNRSELTESQSGAALLLASLSEGFTDPPPAKKAKH